jgi:hypothetical protein
MQRIYDREINASIAWSWDAGFHVKLGDAINGIIAERTVMTWDEVEGWLRNAIVRHLPNSEFAKQTNGEVPNRYRAAL